MSRAAAGGRFITRFRVRYAETDQMGVAYHTHYLVWCEVGRTDLIRQLGGSYRDIEREGTLLAVAEATIRYHSAARYEDLVRVETWIERLQSRSITFAYEVWREEDDGPDVRLATATTKLVALDRSGAPRVMPGTLIDRFRNASAVRPL